MWRMAGFGYRCSSWLPFLADVISNYCSHKANETRGVGLQVFGATRGSDKDSLVDI